MFGFDPMRFANPVRVSKCAGRLILVSEFLQSVMSSWADTQPPFFGAWLKTAIVRSLESRCCVE